MDVSVVIPNWNGLKLLEGLFEDLRAQTRLPEEVVVVDNGSGDGSAGWARRQGARVIEFETNRGFAPAVNAGVAAARGEAVAVLNNDVRLRPDWIEKASAALAGEASFVTGKVLDLAGAGRIDATFDAMSAAATAWRCGHGAPDGEPWSRPATVQFPPFTAVLLRRDRFLELGGLDEAFESYLEDVDFGLRCASRGYTGRYEPGAVTLHAGSATRGRWHPRTVRQISRNQVLLLSRHYTPRMLRRFGWKIAVGQLLWGLLALRHGRGLAWLGGKVDGLRAFGRLRGPGDERLIPVIENSEAAIRQFYPAASPDLYWRLYFALT